MIDPFKDIYRVDTRAVYKVLYFDNDLMVVQGDESDESGESMHDKYCISRKTGKCSWDHSIKFTNGTRIDD